MRPDDLTVLPIRRILTERELDGLDLNGTTVAHADPDVTEAGLYVDEDLGELVAAYFPLDPDLVEPLRAAVRRIEYSQTVRQSTGSRNDSRTFGMAPRKIYQRRESCRPAALAKDQPDEHATLVSLADDLAAMLATFAPEIYAADVEEAEQIDQSWRISDRALWTSGVVNRTSTLPYHRDGFNFDMWSAMPVVRRGIRGGHLRLPGYGRTVECRDGWVLFFNGYRVMHGVTPIRSVMADSYRYSVVYYALRGMKDCFEHAREQAEAGRRRTGRETGIAAAVRGDAPFKVGGRS